MAKVEVTMPKMGESITEGTVLTWHKKPGDTIELDETILEIGTDKVDTEVPSPAAGRLAQILIPEGETVDVGTPLALIETEAGAELEAVSAPAPPAREQAAKAESVPAQQKSAPAAPPSKAQEAPKPTAAPVGGKTVDIVMPQMGESIMEGTIIAWLKKPGDPVQVDESLLEIATDKVDTEVPSTASGVLKEILYQDGDTVQVGARIAVIATEAGAAAAPESAQPAPSDRQEPALASQPKITSGDGAAQEFQTEAASIPRKGPDGRFYSPLVRSIAETEGLSMEELQSVQGSGREGRITKQDLMSYLEARKSRPAAPKQQPAAPRPQSAPAVTSYQSEASDYDGNVEIIEMDRMRQIIAAHMIRSKATSAHVTSFAEADVTNLVRLREKAKDAFLQQNGVKLTYTPFFIQAAIEALREHPLFNASVEETRIVVKKDYHIGVAVAIGKKGLVAPVIRNAGDKNLTGLARATADLAERARNKQLQPDELQGGTFTMTNIGSLGSLMGTPIINQPQVAIIATGAVKKRPVVLEDPELGDIIAIRSMMYLSLSYDHRIIDGAMGSSFLQKFVEVIESIDPNGEV